MTDYYAVLGVPRNATSIEIRDAYLKLARDTHPDKVKDPEARKRAEDAFMNVTAAYDTLSKERARREYSARLPNVEETKSAPRADPPKVQGAPLPPREGTRPSAPASPDPASVAIPTSGRIEFDAIGQGIEAFRKQDFHTAVQLLNFAVANDEANPRAHAMLSMALSKNPNWVRDAIQHMETATKLEPKNASYFAELALLLNAQGLKLRAKRALENGMALNAEHPDVARAMKEISLDPSAEPETPARTTSETSRGLFDRLRKR
jgi:curved DNA-binding protein CbpA